MKILVISHTMVVDIYREKLNYLLEGKHNEILLIIPKKWREAGRTVEPQFDNEKYQNKTVRHFLGFHGAIFIYGLKLYYIIKQFKPDILYLEEEYYGLAAFQVAWMRNRIDHNIKLIFFTSQNINKGYLFPFNLIEKYVLKNADAAFAVSNEAGEVLSRKGFAKPCHTLPLVGVKQIPKEVDLLLPRNGRPFVIGYVGMLVKVKAVDTLLRAVDDLDFPHKLHIVGDGVEVNRLRELAQQLGIQARVKWIGRIPHSNVRNAMQEMDVLVLPSRTLPNVKEQFGRVLTEAMACGVPVIGSSSGAIPQVIGDAGLVFHEDCHTELAMLLQKLYAKNDLNRDLVLRGYRRVKSLYSHVIVGKKMLRFFEDLLSK